jgi:beta-glucosidase-like glycosyl hydrolase
MLRYGLPLVTLCVALPLAGNASEPPPLYKDAHAPVDARVRDLLSRMTLEEKAAQTQALWLKKPLIQDAQGRFSPEKAASVIPNGLGQIARPSEVGPSSAGGAPASRGPREHAEYVNAVQNWALEHTRLGIPVMFHEEALHGLAAPKATHFPVPMGLASTWDPELLEKVMSVAAREARGRGCQEVLSPVVDLARDPRWGRTEETYGEDSYLVSRMGVAAVRGYQGTSLPLGADKVFATLKHFAGHGPNEGGVNTAPSSFGERYLREELLLPFQVAIGEAGPYAVMPSYNEVDGVPAHKNRWLLDEVLRREWGFEGLVVSDYFAIAQLKDRHLVAKDLAEAGRVALEAGVDIELPDVEAYGTLVDQVRDGRISQTTLDTAAARVLKAKFLAGLFDDPFVDPARAEAVSNAPEHQAVALQVAREAVVLLKNEKGLLPLDRRKLKTLAVIGPNAKGVHLGGYSSDPGRGVDVLDGVTAAAGSGVRVTYSEGTRITEDDPVWWRDAVHFGDPVKNRERIAAAAAVAAQADAVLVVIGTNESTSREAWADAHLGDASSLDLTGQQDELVAAVVATGRPVVALLLNGRPLTINRVAETVPAILEGWYLGQEGGTAVGEILFGDVSPSGKLPITIPRSVGQLPIYYSRKPTSFRSYVDSTREPLFAFGHGLSYARFAYADLKVTPATIGPAGSATVSIAVTNQGQVKADEVVQLYVRDTLASVTRPVKELRGFKRVALAPGETKRVELPLMSYDLSFLDDAMQRVVEPGRFEVMVGGNSTELVRVPLDVVARQ